MISRHCNFRDQGRRVATSNGAVKMPHEMVVAAFPFFTVRCANTKRRVRGGCHNNREECGEIIYLLGESVWIFHPKRKKKLRRDSTDYGRMQGKRIYLIHAYLFGRASDISNSIIGASITNSGTGSGIPTDLERECGKALPYDTFPLTIGSPGGRKNGRRMWKPPQRDRIQPCEMQL